jgi:cellulose synthase/poly-beta-1,6-N-acetylglucosamine synthase-like glycosyltransferase
VVKGARDARGRIRSRADRERAGGDGSANDSGEWDWYFSLSSGEQLRLRAHFSDSPTASSPDQYAQAVAWRIRSEDIEVCMSEWVRATALKDAAAMLARGQVPTFPYDAVTTYDVGAMFGPDGAIELARYFADERERAPKVYDTSNDLADVGDF